MRHPILRFFLPLLAAGLLAGATHAAPTWGTDLDEGLARAARENRPVLVNFTGSDWCGFCIKLKDEVFALPAFEAWAKDHVVLVELDFPRRKEQPAEVKARNAELRDRFGVRGFPTVVMLAPNGEEIGRFRGYPPGSGEKRLEEFKAMAARGAAGS